MPFGSVSNPPPHASFHVDFFVFVIGDFQIHTNVVFESKLSHPNVFDLFLLSNLASSRHLGIGKFCRFFFDRRLNIDGFRGH